MLSPGQTFERYTVEAVIGQGGMAVVYRVRHNQLGSLHALKILTVPKPHIRERLLVEGRAQAAIRHPNVVSVFDVVEIDGAPALLMEYVDGPTLETWLEHEEPTLDEAEELFRGVCAGVGEAHGHGLVHRDLKPANVLLAPVRGGWMPKVTDFGIAKLVAGDVAEGSTRSNIAMGTPHYMAPEQIRDAKSVDQRADVFSLGCILYELVTGEKPFVGPDVLTVLNSVATGRYASPRKHVPELPDRFVRAIEGALRVDRELRLQDCVSLVDVLSGGAPNRTNADVTWPPPGRRRTTTGHGSAPPPSPPTMENAVPAPDKTPESEPAEPQPPNPLDDVIAPPVAAFADDPTGPPPEPAGVVPVQSWFDEDARPEDLPAATPITPIDPNASTVPKIQRLDSARPPRRAGDRPILGVIVGLSLVVGFVVVLIIGIAGEDPVKPVPRVDDEPVLSVTRDAAAKATVDVEPTEADPPVEVEPPSDKPRTLVEPSAQQKAAAIGATKPPPSKGLGLFGAESKPKAGHGRVEIVGDVKATLLVRGKKDKVPVGEVPVGAYDVQVTFPGADPRVALQIDVKDGQVVKVDCAAVWGTCSVAP